MSSFSALAELMQRLRDPDTGCPWSREQTLQSLVPHTLEEVYEVIDAIEQHDMSALQSELADLLLQVAFYSEIAKEQQAFDLSAVEQTCIDKQLQRKPHVLSGANIDAEQAVKQWDAIKQELRQDDDLFNDIATTLPALLRAKKIQQRAASIGFDWADLAPVFSKCREELDEVQSAIAEQDQQAVAEEIGDLLFACVNLARHVKVDPEYALLQANHKFMQRLRIVQDLATQRELDLNTLSLDELDVLWREVKADSD